MTPQHAQSPPCSPYWRYSWWGGWSYCPAGPGRWCTGAWQTWSAPFNNAFKFYPTWLGLPGRGRSWLGQLRWEERRVGGRICIHWSAEGCQCTPEHTSCSSCSESPLRRWKSGTWKLEQKLFTYLVDQLDANSTEPIWWLHNHWPEIVRKKYWYPASTERYDTFSPLEARLYFYFRCSIKVNLAEFFMAVWRASVSSGKT